jgi:hypothetical protein
MNKKNGVDKEIKRWFSMILLHLCNTRIIYREENYIR